MSRSAHAVVTALACVFSVAATAGNLNFLNDTALTSLSDADRKLQLAAVMSVLESTNAKSAKEWTNPASGAAGRAQGMGNLTSDDGLRCRRVQMQTEAKGVKSQFSFPVCKNTAGEWFIASGMKLKPM